MSSRVSAIFFGGIVMFTLGCTAKPKELDILRHGRSLPAALPEGAVALNEFDAKIVRPVQPEQSASRIWWKHPVSGVTINLYLGAEYAYPKQGNSSRLEVTARNVSGGGMVVPSLITKDWCRGRGPEILPRVHFSPSGKTVLFEEDVSDASPVYNNLLFVVDTDSGRVEERVLNLPRKTAALPYGIAADVLSITDEDVTLAFFPDKLYFKMAFEKIGDMDRELDSR